MEALFYVYHIVAERVVLAYSLMMKYHYLLLSCAVLSAHADVYRRVDGNGNVTFSDQPHPQAEKIEIEILPSYTPVAIPEDVAPVGEEQQEDKEVPNYKIEIVSPIDDETIRANVGTVVINVSVTPTLDQDRSDQVVVKLDGQELGEPSSSSSFTLTNIERGTHTVQVSIIDKSKKVLKSSKTVTFHLQRIAIQ